MVGDKCVAVIELTQLESIVAELRAAAAAYKAAKAA